MNEIDFFNWKIKTSSLKLTRDACYRLKAIEKSLLSTDIDSEYKKDRCKTILLIFKNKGINNEMETLTDGSLPIGKYYLSTYKQALKQYVTFLSQFYAKPAQTQANQTSFEILLH